MHLKRILLSGILLPAVVCSPALAAVPSPANSTIPAHINLVASAGGVVDPFGTFTVTVRDAASNPITGSTVVVDFSACASLGLGQAMPANVVSCSAKTVTAISDASGVATFDIAGFAYACGGCGQSQCAIIKADLVPLGTISVGAFDLDGTSGLDPSDVSLWLADFELGCESERTDYDGNGKSLASDLSILLQRINDGNDTESAGRCDGLPNTQVVVTGGALNFHWDDCLAGGGTLAKSFACATNTGAETMVGSIVPSSTAAMVTGFTADIVVQTNSPVLSPWWSLKLPGGCRAGALSLSVDFTIAPSACDAWTGMPNFGDILSFTTPDGSNLNRARVRILGVSTPPVTLNASTEYALFKFNLGHSKTTGTGSCAGCSVPACILLEQVLLTQLQDPGCPGGAVRPNFKIVTPGSGNTLSWQTTVPACQGATSARQDTWGHLKSLYR